jgi:hypothetical protein
MDTVQFRDFIFRHNPHNIQMSAPQATASHFCHGVGEIVQGMGEKARIVKCSGSFFGDTYTQAMAQLLEFRAKTAKGEAGMLFLPGIPPFMARLREFVFDAVGDGRIIAYTMEFVEVRAS